MSKFNAFKTGEESSILLDFGVLLFNLMMLNVMWFICCLPVVTIGASTTALNYTCIKMRRDEGDSIVRMFFGSFASNIRQALFIGTGMLAILIILFAGLIQAIGYAANGSAAGIFFSISLVTLLCLWLLLFTYLFMVQARFDNTIDRTIVNACYFLVKEFRCTLQIFGIELFTLIILPIFLWTLFPYGFPMVIFFGVPTTAYLLSKIFNVMFDRYIG